MAVLTDDARREIWAEFMQEMSRSGETTSLTKDQLRAAFDALDTWLDANALTINSAIPQPARGELTAAQKARLLAYVIRQRYIKGA